MFLGRRLQRVQIRDPELLPQDLDFLWSKAADLEQVEDARRELCAELFVVRYSTGGHVLRDLLGQVGTDALDLRDPPRTPEVFGDLPQRLELFRGPLLLHAAERVL